MNGNTFREIEQSLGVDWKSGQPSSKLEQWYEQMRDTPLTDLADGDLSIALRQELYPKWVVPRALLRLKTDPLAGERYDGELLVALASIPKHFWSDNLESASQLSSILGSVSVDPEFENLADAVRALRGHVQVPQ